MNTLSFKFDSQYRRKLNRGRRPTCSREMTRRSLPATCRFELAQCRSAYTRAGLAIWPPAGGHARKGSLKWMEVLCYTKAWPCARSIIVLRMREQLERQRCCLLRRRCPQAQSTLKPCVERQKNDATDAEAICEAVIRANVRFVPATTPSRRRAA
jgi:hypothetical protein